MNFLNRPTPSKAQPAPVLKDPDSEASVQEEARHRLATSRLGARCLLTDGQEFACLARNITMTQVEIHTTRTIDIGARTVLYLDVLGLVGGTAYQRVAGGYLIALQIAKQRQADFAASLEAAAIANRNAPDERVAPRIVPKITATQIELVTGRKMPAEIIDLSTTGVAIRMTPRPGIGASIVVGQAGRRATVVRLTTDGIAAQFNAPIPMREFGPDIKL